MPGSLEEARQFAEIQQRLAGLYRDVFSDPRAPRTVVVIPSMSLDERELVKIPGVVHYEERLLCLLMLLRLPKTQLIYVTSTPIDSAVIDYYLHLLPGIPGMHAKRRLRLITCNDPSLTPLSAKLLSMPEKLWELRNAITNLDAAHMTCFNTTDMERTLAVQLGIPMYACDPDLSYLGTKSSSRKIFREVGLGLPDGFEDLRDRSDLVAAILELTSRNSQVGRLVVKLNEGFSGEGNAVLDIRGLDEHPSPERELVRRLTEELRFEAKGETWEPFETKFRTMGGIVEVMVEDSRKRSPSVQMRLDPLGMVQLVSTHDQILAGPTGQVYEGCTFPARKSYRLDLHDAGKRVAIALRDRGVVGRFAVDFVSVPTKKGWRHLAIEINLRKGGTTLPYLMLEFLTEGSYDEETGVFSTPTGDARTYYATDNLVKPAYRGLTPSDVIDMAVYEGLHFDAPAQEGLVFHLLGAVTQHGKIGMVSIAGKRKQARDQYNRAVDSLDRATARRYS